MANDAVYGNARGYQGGAYMSVPIQYRPPGGTSRCVGVINLTDRHVGDRFTATDQKLVSAAANQIGAAIELARLIAKEREQQRLHDELALAHDLQLSLLPDPSVLQGDARVAVRCLPAEQVGGDFYTFNRLGLGLVGVMVGDVSSHGFSAALVIGGRYSRLRRRAAGPDAHRARQQPGRQAHVDRYVSHRHLLHHRSAAPSAHLGQRGASPRLPDSRLGAAGAARRDRAALGTGRIA